jgi:hypothetical protein
MLGYAQAPPALATAENCIPFRITTSSNPKLSCKPAYTYNIGRNPMRENIDSIGFRVMDS